MNARADSFAMAMAAAAPQAAARPPASSRRAALLLHAVGADDRAWLLAQLPAQERHLMETLLADLRELEIPADRELLGEIAETAQALPAPAGALAEAAPAVVARVLAAEPLDLLVRVFALGPWPWGGAVLAALSPLRREQLQDRLKTARRPAAATTRSLLDARLLDLLEARVARAAQDMPRGAAASPAVRGPRFMPVWMRRWLITTPASARNAG